MKNACNNYTKVRFRKAIKCAQNDTFRLLSFNEEYLQTGEELQPTIYFFSTKNYDFKISITQ